MTDKKSKKARKLTPADRIIRTALEVGTPAIVSLVVEVTELSPMTVRSYFKRHNVVKTSYKAVVHALFVKSA